MDNQEQVNASIPVGKPRTGASPESGIDLQQLAELIRNRWPSLNSEAMPGLMTQSLWVGPGIIFDTRDDTANSAFVIWGLDRLEELRLCFTLSKYGSPESGSYGYHICTMEQPRGVFGRGKTRAEAIANALILRLLQCAPATVATNQKQEPNPTPANKESTSQKEVTGGSL